MNKRVRELVTANGGKIVGEEYFPLDHCRLSARRSARSWRAAPRWCSTRSSLRGSCRSSSSSTTPASRSAAGSSSAPISTRTFSACCRRRTGRGPVQLPRLLPERRPIPSARRCSTATTRAFPARPQFTGGSACSGLYRACKLWEAAVKEAGSLRQDDVIAALDHARIAEGPGRPGRNGARPAPCSHEHVHRPGEERQVRDRRRASAISIRRKRSSLRSRRGS